LADVNTGAAGTLRLDVWESGTNAAENWSDVSWALYLIERTTSNLTWSGGGITATVGHHNVTQWWGGTFGFDWRPGGLQTKLIASGTNRVWHNSDGTGSITVGANIGNTGTSGAGGPSQVTQTITLTTLKVAPGTPSGVTATRISDTQAQVNWSQSSASNGQPTSNDISWRINGGAWNDGGGYIAISPSTSALIGTAANRKTEFKVRAVNSAAYTPWTQAASPVYTTPGTPTSVTAAKSSSLDIQVSFNSTVAYNEHEHEVQHGTVSGGVTTWDAGILATLPAGTTTYTHVAPNSAQVHAYRVRAKAGALTSDWGTTNSVQLLVAPNKPTVPSKPPFANKAAVFRIDWTHNPIDTTPQTNRELQLSTNGGSSWTGAGKVATSSNFYDVPANTYAGDVALTYRVRTWGSATTGGAEGTGASPWSDPSTVTFKTVPAATIIEPANSSTINDATVRASLGFSSPESASFVKAQVELLQGATLLETLESTILLGITLATQAANDTSYTVRARVLDSNGLWSPWVSSTFTVDYLSPVTPSMTLIYLSEQGLGQIDLTIPEPGAGEDNAELVTVTRTIDGVTEDVVRDYPVRSALTFLDTTPTIHGVNTYTVTVTSPLGAQTSVSGDMVTSECRKAFLSKGPSFNQIGVFGGNLEVDETLGVSAATVQAAGRQKPIGLYGVETSVQLKVSSFIFEGFGSSIEELRNVLLVPGKACFRDATGRRTFGVVKGSVSYTKTTRGELSFTLTETS
jgi:hypothetical protein